MKSRPITKARIPRLPPLQKSFPHIIHTENHAATVSNVNMSWEEEVQWSHLCNETFLLTIANNVLCKKTRKPLTYCGLMKTENKKIWEMALANKLGRLMQGVGTPITKGTKTLFSVKQKNLQAGCKAAYAKIVVGIRPQKKEKHRARLVVGGNRVDYPNEVSTKTVDLDTTKMFLNLIISTPNAQFMTMDIKDFYLDTPLHRYEYLQLQYDNIPN